MEFIINTLFKLSIYINMYNISIIILYKIIIILVRDIKVWHENDKNEYGHITLSLIKNVYYMIKIKDII